MFWLLVASVCALHVTRADYRLPGDVTPIHYDVRLIYDIDHNTNYSFYGVVHILVQALKPTKVIVLHAQDFNIVERKISLTPSLDPYDVMTITKLSLRDTHNFLMLELQRNLVENENYSLKLPFYGNIGATLSGAYISTYYDKKTNTDEYLLATHFQPLFARKAFPCFDEPLYKATFRITIGHDKGYTAVSNMPLENSTQDNILEPYWQRSVIETTFNKSLVHFVYDQFVNSVPMSTYLIAYVISKFAYKQSPRELSRVEFRTWARRDAVDQATYASIIGPKILSHFERWYKVDYPLPKMDMFALPDLAGGAMENWGLITYREIGLLYDKKQTSHLLKESLALVIAHELTHQWFGNLVTMEWWSDLWLNEGFATFAESLGVAALEPSWQADTKKAVHDMMNVLDLDAFESSHPVSVPVDDPKRINEIFDSISYGKGSILVRMMTMFLGQDVFREAVHKYLVKYSYSNAEQDDLWQQLTDTSEARFSLPKDVSVKTIMDTWTTQTGYPLLTVQREYDTNTVSITQKRYLTLDARSPSRTSWWVPLSKLCRRDNSPAPLQWLGDKEGVSEVQRFSHGAGPEDWLLFNYDMIALYRVNYDPLNWQLLTRALKTQHGAVPVLGRVQLLSDAFELAATNRLDYSVALQLASYLQHEREYLPLDTALRALNKIGNLLKRDPEFGVFQTYVSSLIEDTYRRVGGLNTKKILNGDDIVGVQMQILTSEWACRMNVRGCEDNAVELFQRWMNTKNPDQNNPIPIDLRSTVYCVGISRGSVRHWRFLLARKQNTNVAAARYGLQKALTCTNEVWLLKQYLEWAITPGSVVRSQDAYYVIKDIIKNTVGFYVAKDFIYKRIADICAVPSMQSFYLKYILQNLLQQFTSQDELDEFLAWREKHKQALSISEQSMEQAVDKARVNIAWIERNKHTVLQELKELTRGLVESDGMVSLRQGLPTSITSEQDRPNNTGVISFTYVLLFCILFK